MKRIALTLVAAAALTFGFGGLFAASAEAHGPHHVYRHHHPHVCYPQVHGVVYRVYPSSPIVYPQYAPYGVGYSTGYYPSSGLYIQQPRFGLRIGF